MSSKVNQAQKKFCEEFVRCGVAKEAYSIAYPNASATTCECNSSKLLKTPAVQEYIEELNKELHRSAVADIEECLELLTEFMRDENATKSERTKAVELRLKTLGAFLDRKQVDMNTETTITVSIAEEVEDETEINE